MARIPPLRRLLSEDFSDQSSWIGKLLEPINNYFEQNTSALTKNLTINDNFSGSIRTVDIDGTFPVRLSWDITARPTTVIVGDVRTIDGSALNLNRAVAVQWSFNQRGELQIDNVVGLLPEIARFVDAAINHTNDTVDLPAHEFQTGDRINLSTSGALPAGLSAGTYHIIKSGTHTIKLATTRTNALTGTAIDLTSATGSGTHILTPQYSRKYRIVLESKTG
jgi:hypothetical protein